MIRTLLRDSCRLRGSNSRFTPAEVDNQSLTPHTLANTSYGFEHVLYTQNDEFNPAADVNTLVRVILRTQYGDANLDTGIGIPEPSTAVLLMARGLLLSALWPRRRTSIK